MVQQSVAIRKTIIFLHAVNVVQITSVITAALYIYLRNRLTGIEMLVSELGVFLLVLVLSVAVNSAFAIRYTNLINRNTQSYDSISNTNSQLEGLNNTLRSQRHDFMNHLQVVYSLIEMDEYKDAKDYIEKVFQDIQKVNRILKTSNPAVNALLQAKIINAEKQGVVVNVSITTQLASMIIPAWEFCRVLGNLIDNAIFELNNATDEKRLWIELSEDLKAYRFKVGNNGPAIPQEIKCKIFSSGFTTKGEKGEGMGLAIVKETLEAYKGDISVISSEAATVFEGFLPKATQ